MALKHSVTAVMPLHVCCFLPVVKGIRVRSKYLSYHVLNFLNLFVTWGASSLFIGKSCPHFILVFVSMIIRKTLHLNCFELWGQIVYNSVQESWSSSWFEIMTVFKYTMGNLIDWISLPFSWNFIQVILCHIFYPTLISLNKVFDKNYVKKKERERRRSRWKWIKCVAFSRHCSLHQLKRCPSLSFFLT